MRDKNMLVRHDVGVCRHVVGRYRNVSTQSCSLNVTTFNSTSTALHFIKLTLTVHCDVI